MSNLYRTARLTNDISALDRRSGARPRWFLAAAVGSLTGGLVNGKSDGPVRRGIYNRPDPPQLARVEHLGHSDWIYQVLVRDASEIDEELLGWICEARSVGDQAHLV